MSRFLMTTTGSEGSVTHFVRLAAALRDRGHEAFLFTHSAFVERFRRSGVPIIPFDTREQHEAFMLEGTLLNDPRTAAECFRRHFLPRIVAECRLIEQLCEPCRTVLVTSDTPGLSARIVAERTGASCVSMLLYPAHVTTMSLCEEFLMRSFGADLGGIRSELKMAGLRSVRSWFRAPRLHLAVWPEWFASVTAGSLRRLEYAGFLWQDDATDAEVAESRTALGMSRRRVLITGGTGNFGTPEFFERCLEACGRLGIEPVVIGNGVVRGASERRGLTWTASVPSLARLMASASLVIHHGGLGTIGQALAAGVPQLIGAAGGDRPNNGALVERLGAGISLPRRCWDVEAVAAAAARLGAGGQIAGRCAEVAGWMRREDAEARALAALESVGEVAAEEAGGGLAAREATSTTSSS